MDTSELACVYAALILADDDVAITAEKIQTILNAAGVEVESYWPGLFAKALKNCNVKDLITNIFSNAGSAIAVKEPVPNNAAQLADGKENQTGGPLADDDASDDETNIFDLFGEPDGGTGFYG